MSYVVVFVLVLLALALPDVCPDVLGLRAHPPDLWIALVVYLALRCRGYRAVGWAVALGLVRDALSIDPLGTHAFVLGTVSLLFCAGRRQRGVVDGALGLLATFAAALLAGWLYPLRVLPSTGALAGADFVRALPVALSTTLLAAILFPVLDRYHLLDEIGARTRGLPA